MENDLQTLLHNCFLNQQAQRRQRRATTFGYSFTAIGLAVAGLLYLVKFNHWFGVR